MLELVLGLDWFDADDGTLMDFSLNMLNHESLDEILDLFGFRNLNTWKLFVAGLLELFSLFCSRFDPQ